MACYTAYDTTGDTWGYWTCNSECSDTSAATTVWRTWTGSTCATGATSTVWVRWASNTATASCSGPYHLAAESKPPTPEEQERLALERERCAEEYRKAEEKRLAEKKVADEMAERLLHSTLTLRQRRSFRKHRHFCVRAADGTRFRLKHGWAGNVEELDARGRAVNRYCIHPREQVPYADNLLAQKLLLETDPATFRRVANRTAIPQRA